MRRRGVVSPLGGTWQRSIRLPAWGTVWQYDFFGASREGRLVYYVYCVN